MRRFSDWARGGGGGPISRIVFYIMGVLSPNAVSSREKDTIRTTGKNPWVSLGNRTRSLQIKALKGGAFMEIGRN